MLLIDFFVQDQINFDDLESGSDNSDKVPEQSETFHTDVFGVARDGAISLQTLVCDIRKFSEKPWNELI